MIALIRGEVFAVNEDNFIIMTGGIGYRVYAPVSRIEPIPALGDEIQLFTYHQVREDAMLLFGFASQAELALFELLISVSGVGAKTALLMLNSLGFDAICQHIMTGSSKALCQTPGIGKKIADRIILELTDKIGKAGWAAVPGAEPDDKKPVPASFDPQIEKLAVKALTQLGYNNTQAKAMVEKAISGLDSSATVEQLIAAALRTASL